VEEICSRVCRANVGGRSWLRASSGGAHSREFMEEGHMVEGPRETKYG
jgi:hypothetical protein